jgi:hypothetical protein
VDGDLIRQSDVMVEIAGVVMAVTTNEHGIAHLYVPNASTDLVQFPRHTRLGTAEPPDQFEVCHSAAVSQITQTRAASFRQKRPTQARLPDHVMQEVQKAMDPQLKGPIRAQFLDLLTSYGDIISKDEHDLGRTQTLQHDVELADRTPVYTQQYRLPLDQLQLVKEHLTAWLRCGIVEKSNSKYNSPVFCVPKKEGAGLRVVLDYRKLNAKSMPDRYSIRTIDQCLEEVGRNGSNIFTCLDLRSGFWQMGLAEQARPYTAFTIPGVGQFQYCVAPMGLAGSPASFARLMDVIMQGLKNTITYIDDCLVHSRSPQDHVTHLAQTLGRLRAHGLKLNMAKCTIGASRVQYLGHTVSGHGVQPGRDKTAALREAKVPGDVKQVRSFVGLCNYFRTFIPGFARIAAPLFKLTRADSEWTKGPLPEDATAAFNSLRKAISEEPVLRLPSAGGAFHLYTDAAQGDERNEGGLGDLILCLLPAHM